MSQPWSVQTAKAKLSRLLALARAGEPQVIGMENGCVVVSEAAWAAHQGKSLGPWLVSSAPRGAPLAEASRTSRRGDPFKAVAKGKRKGR